MALRWIALGALVAGCMSTAQAEEGDFFPLEVGNRWVFQKYDTRYSNVFRLGPEETVSTEVIGQVQLKERSYFVVRQDWNGNLPDTLYLRKEGAQVFRYLEQPDTVAAGDLAQDMDSPDPHPLDPNQTDWLVYDFEAPQGTAWDLPLPEKPSSPFVVIWWVLPGGVLPDPFRNPSGWGGCCLPEPFRLAPTQRLFRFFSTGFTEEWDEVFEVGVGPIYITRFTTEVELWNFGLLKEAHIGGQIITRDWDWTTPVEQISWGQLKTSR